MKIVILFIAICLFVGCGNSGGGAQTQLGLNPTGNQNCTFQLSGFMNGSTRQNATTYWDCIGGGTRGIFLIYSDGTGESTAAGAFTWNQTGCNSAHYEGGTGDGDVTDIQGSTSSGIITFKDNSNGQVTNVSCTLQNI